MNQQWSMLAAMMRGTQVHKMVQHGCLCKYGCICKTPPDVMDGPTSLLCESIIQFILAQGWVPISAETPVAGRKRADLVCRDRFGKIKIIELKTGFKTIMKGLGASPRNQRKHLLQACAYGIAWNSSEFRHSVGECDTVLIHYPDTKLRAWFWVTSEMWSLFCPPPPPPKVKKVKKPKKAKKPASKKRKRDSFEDEEYMEEEAEGEEEEEEYEKLMNDWEAEEAAMTPEPEPEPVFKRLPPLKRKRV